MCGLVPARFAPVRSNSIGEVPNGFGVLRGVLTLSSLCRRFDCRVESPILVSVHFAYLGFEQGEVGQTRTGHSDERGSPFGRVRHHCLPEFGIVVVCPFAEQGQRVIDFVVVAVELVGLSFVPMPQLSDETVKVLGSTAVFGRVHKFSGCGTDREFRGGFCHGDDRFA
jgi:hypothetical protein